jgi:acetyltransferase-like isoleucine patch superfamily enzyme
MGMVKVLKILVKALLYRPKLGFLGKDSFILLPRWVHNPGNIEIGKNSIIGRFCVLHPVIKYKEQKFSSKIKIGSNVYIGGYNQIHAMNLIEIEDGCVLSEHVYISDIAHGFDPNGGLIMQQNLECKGPVHIGANTFIGYGVSIMPDVSLGRNCIVGTRSVVTHSFPDYSMIAGSPAKLLKKYCLESNEWISVK